MTLPREREATTVRVSRLWHLARGPAWLCCRVVAGERATMLSVAALVAWRHKRSMPPLQLEGELTALSTRRTRRWRSPTGGEQAPRPAPVLELVARTGRVSAPQHQRRAQRDDRQKSVRITARSSPHSDTHVSRTLARFRLCAGPACAMRRARSGHRIRALTTGAFRAELLTVCQRIRSCAVSANLGHGPTLGKCRQLSRSAVAASGRRASGVNA